MGRQTTPDIYKLLRENNKNLRNINKSICSTGTAGAVGDATEATLQDILAELKDDRAIAEAVVKDSNDLVLIRRTEVNQDTGVKTTTYLDPDTGVVIAPTFPLVVDASNPIDKEYFAAQLVIAPNTPIIVEAEFDGTNTVYTRLDTGAVITTADFEPLISSGDTYELVKGFDDNNDNTLGTLTKVWQNIKIDKDGVRTIVGYLEEDRVTTHTIVGNFVDPDTETQTNVVAFTLGNTAPNNIFTTSSLMQSVSIDVVSILDPNNPPTITTFAIPGNNSSQLIKPLREGRAITFDSENGDLRIVPGIVITSQIGDIIDIIYTEKVPF